MKSGKLRNKITIEQASEAQDSMGEPDATWSTFATVWGSIDAVSGRETFDAQQFEGKVDHRIRIRYKSGVVPKMRVKIGARIFEITTVLNPENRNRELELLCFERI